MRTLSTAIVAAVRLAVGCRATGRTLWLSLPLLSVPGMQEHQVGTSSILRELNHQKMTRNNGKSGHRHKYPLVVETKPSRGLE